MAGLVDFKGRMPYASELSGVFQPLLGWRGASGRRIQRRALIERVSAVAARGIGAGPAAGLGLPADFRSGVAVLDQLVALAAARYPGRADLQPDEWRALLTPDVVQSAVDGASRAMPGPEAAFAVRSMPSPLASFHQSAGAIVSQMVAQQPDALNSLLPANASAVALDYLSRFPRLADAVLTPIGLLELFRQYFFEFDSFLGPPVAHVWVSPGATVELIESTVQRRVVERSIESLVEVTTKSEMTIETKDELSEAVKQDNADDMKVALSASGGFNVGVAHGEASATFDLNQHRQTAMEQTHKRSRAQTEKKSTEIRQSYKTTFRTLSEQTDTTSKRYVLQNATDKLINYELRRKMRRVGVQLQHLGTRLCWQYYLDEPGQGLRVSQLVHLAHISDADLGLKPPEAPPAMDPKEEDFIALLALVKKAGWGAQSAWDENFFNGVAQEDPNKTVEWRFHFTQPPPNGYELQAFAYLDKLPQAELEGRPILLQDPVISLDPDPNEANKDKALQDARAAGKFLVAIPGINFHSALGLRIRLKLRYAATAGSLQQGQAEFAKRQADYTDQRARAYQESFIKAVRERIKAAGDVRTRLFDDLREEERHAVYRRLIDALTHNAEAMHDKHLAAELVRQFFDVDAILYFVAPDWWDPSVRRRAQLGAATPETISGETITLKSTDTVGWGDHVNTVGDPYLVTEESRAAPLGASIGWVLQLDGDRMRNAFLNSSWAKVVVPIRPGHEREAIAWLRDQAEQEVGLNTPYLLQPNDPQEWAGKKLEDVLDALVTKLQAEHDTARKVDSTVEALPGERVFEKGFDPLAGGVRFDAEALTVFDQWVEMLPTDQVVAVGYEPKD